jgi:hypothetical protein
MLKACPLRVQRRNDVERPPELAPSAAFRNSQADKSHSATKNPIRVPFSYPLLEGASALRGAITTTAR